MPELTFAVQVAEYDPRWPRIFSQLRKYVWPCVNDVAVAIEHVGSTSVPGLSAKPVIDLDVIAKSNADLPLLIERLQSIGYKHRGDLGVKAREAFVSPTNQPRHHLYLCVQNCLPVWNHLALRDYLRGHASSADAYSSLKKRLAKQFANDKDRYMEGKTEFILSILGQCGFSDKELEAIRSVNCR